MKEKNKPTKEEILKDNLCDYTWFKLNYLGTFNHVLLAMQEYAESYHKKKLI